MVLSVNTLSISGTITNNNYIQGNWNQPNNTVYLSFSYLGVKNSNVTGGLSPGWYALTTNGGRDYGNNLGWIFAVAAPAGNTSGNFFLIF